MTGNGWWAMAIFTAFVARLAFLSVQADDAACLLLLIITVWRGTAAIHPGIKHTIVLSSALLMLHWLLFVPGMRLPGLLICRYLCCRFWPAP